MGNFCDATSQSWGSNPDRSPVAQWLNMRISPASCLPAPSLCLQGSIQNPCAARRRREAPCGAGGFQKSQYWPEFPSIPNPCLARRWRQAPCGGEGFQKSQYWPKLRLVYKICTIVPGRQGRFRDLAGSRPPRLRSESRQSVPAKQRPARAVQRPRGLASTTPAQWIGSWHCPGSSICC